MAQDGVYSLNLTKFLALRLAILSPRFQSIVNTISEFGITYSVENQEMISQAVVDCLFNHNICAIDSGGKAIPVRSVFDHSLLKKMHLASLVGHSEDLVDEASNENEKFNGQQAGYNAWMSKGKGLPNFGVEHEEWKATAPKPADMPVGMLIVKDLRMCQSHGQDYVTRLLELGWPLILLERLAVVLCDCVMRGELKFKITDSGYPKVLPGQKAKHPQSGKSKTGQSIDPTPTSL